MPNDAPAFIEDEVYPELVEGQEHKAAERFVQETLILLLLIARQLAHLLPCVVGQMNEDHDYAFQNVFICRAIGNDICRVRSIGAKC